MEYFCILNIPKRPKFAIITPSNRSLRKDTIKAARKPLHTSFPHNYPSSNKEAHRSPYLPLKSTPSHHREIPSRIIPIYYQESPQYLIVDPPASHHEPPIYIIINRVPFHNEALATPSCCFNHFHPCKPDVKQM